MQFNLWNPQVVDDRILDLMKVAELSDSTRVDTAMLLLNREIEANWGVLLKSQGYFAPEQEFWVRAIKEVKEKYPNFMFLAEAYRS